MSPENQMQTIYKHYTDDHERLDALFHQFQSLKATDPDAAQKRFQEFKAGLERHIVWEEEILFPTFENKTGQFQGGPTVVMRWEHRLIREYLNGIAAKLSRNAADTREEELALENTLSQHNQKEEMILYPAIDQITDDDERTQIFAEMGRRG